MRDLCEKVGVTAPAIASWESDKAVPRPRYMKPLAEALLVEESYFTEGSKVRDEWHAALTKVVEQATDLVARRMGIEPERVKIQIDY